MSYSDILPIERNLSTGFHHWVLQNAKLSKVLTDPHNFVRCDDGKIILVDLNLLKLDYRLKFIEPNIDAYITSFLKKAEKIIYSMMATYGLLDFKTTYHFKIGSIIMTREATYFFISKIS